MATNLPPQYFEVEKKLKTAKTNQEKIEIYEELLAIIPKHKASEKLQAQLKTKLSQLRAAPEKKSAAARHASAYLIDRSGAGQIVVLGPPNSGKSSFVQALTGASCEVADYPFTTKTPAPFMMKYEDVRVQLIDTPPLTVDFMETGLAEAVKVADGVILVLDVASPEAPSDLENAVLKLREKKIELIPESAPVPESVPPYHKRSLAVANKSDLDPGGEKLADLRALFPDWVEILPFVATGSEGVEDMRRRVFHMLGVIRVYSKAPGKKADKQEPFTLKSGSTVQDMARAVHKDFSENLKYARLWRALNSSYQGNMVNRDQGLEDGDVVELHI
jgi:ribosome-interacting GTPase 1